MKSPLFRIDKAMKAVQEALLDGELGEEVRDGRGQRRRRWREAGPALQGMWALTVKGD